MLLSIVLGPLSRARLREQRFPGFDYVSGRVFHCSMVACGAIVFIVGLYVIK